MIKVLAVVGARPQYIKHAALQIASHKFKSHIDFKWMDTGQHYDPEMSEVFKDELELSPPIKTLKLSKETKTREEHIEEMKLGILQVVKNHSPELILVYGDTNSTLAASLVAKAEGIKLAHVEAGLRSYNMDMPEEKNRVKTDQLADLLFVPNQAAVENLRQENISKGVFITGDVMYDLIQFVNSRLNQNAESEKYIYLSLHRPYNVDAPERLRSILKQINSLGTKVIFPIHPRTEKRLLEFNISKLKYPNLQFLKPLSYIKNVACIKNSKQVITDSGGLQKEAYWLGVPCITIRSETEWKETLIGDWNRLLFNNLDQLGSVIKAIPDPAKYNSKLYSIGNSGEIIFQNILNYFSKN